MIGPAVSFGSSVKRVLTMFHITLKPGIHIVVEGR